VDLRQSKPANREQSYRLRRWICGKTNQQTPSNRIDCDGGFAAKQTHNKRKDRAPLGLGLFFRPPLVERDQGKAGAL
jgi:hypothetical protein